MWNTVGIEFQNTKGNVENSYEITRINSNRKLTRRVYCFWARFLVHVAGQVPEHVILERSGAKKWKDRRYWYGF